MPKYVTVPESAVLLNELHIVEYLDPDGDIKYVDLSRCSDGDDLDAGKRYELAQRAMAFEVALMALELMHEYASECEEEDER